MEVMFVGRDDEDHLIEGAPHTEEALVSMMVAISPL
jgi:hypothetical protein